MGNDATGQQTAGGAARSSADRQGAAASLLNGLTVLEAFSRSSTPTLGVTEIADLVGLHKSTVSRMLAGLTEAGYVQREASTSRYRLGTGMIGLAGPLLADLDVRHAALPHLETMTARTGETSALAVWNGAEAVVVEQTPSPHFVKHTATIGTRYHRAASSSVRVFLGELEHEELVRLLGSGIVECPGYSGEGHGIHARIAEDHERGHAINAGETDPDEYGVSVPVRDYRGDVVCCVTASAPRARVEREGSADALLAAAREAARDVGIRLGAAE